MIINDLEAMGFEVEAGHHEVAPGQHEIDFKYADALTTADDLATFRFIVRNAAMAHDLHATFMPKPIFGQNGSGMHTHQSLFTRDGNAFFDAEGEYQISETMRHYIGGLKAHARAIAAITNPIVNSYKRLVPGYEAPVNIAWSQRNRSPLIRVPDRRGAGTRVEFRMPDPSCNPYLALAVQLAAGLDGVRNEIDPGPPVDTNVWQLSEDERRKYQMDSLPANLKEAVEELEKDDVLTEALGEHILTHFVEAKQKEWSDYIAQVTDWELATYLATY
jgi:glutamine synthetase